MISEPAEAGAPSNPRDIELMAMKMAEKLRFIRSNHGRLGSTVVDGALENLEGELMAMARAASYREPGLDNARGAAAREKYLRTRHLVRFILHSFSTQVQAGQRAATYSRQDCLDDMESLLETVLEWLSAGCEE